MRLLIKSFLILLTLLTLETAVYAIDATRTTADNGLTVLHLEKNNLPIVMVNLLIKASRLNEASEKSGLAYLTSEMLTEGTTTRSSKQISEDIEFMGAQLETSVTPDFTTVSLAVLKKDLSKGFEIFSDVVLNPSFPEDEVLQKKEIVKGIIKQNEETPSYLANKAYIKEIYGDHPYGRTDEGSPETVDSITAEDLSNFHKTFYNPNNSILSVVGNITVEELQNLVKQYFSNWQNNNINCTIVGNIYKESENKIITINKNLTQANIIIGNKGIKRTDPDYYAFYVMNYILGGGGFASRLMQTIRDEMGLAYDIQSVIFSYKQGGDFQIIVQTKNEFANKVIHEITEMMKKIKNTPVKEQELQDAKSYLTGSFPRRLDTMANIANFLALTEFYGLGMDYDKNYIDIINAITINDVKAAAEKYLDDKNYMLTIVGDTGKIKMSNPNKK
ncbi:peptidase M16 domain-containing protein [Candidatus Magnetoovum chiemensis]|nr:peptidase M16 domain-containing protein [Candidatus Magnetoovum chiemensis]